MSPRTPAALLLPILAAGCVTLSRPAPPTQEYQIDYDPPPVEGSALPVVIRVAPFHAADLYGTDAIIYREDDHRVGSYAYHRWVSDVATMIGDLIARDLAASGLYRAVLQGPSLLRYQYAIEATVERVEERVGPSCTARVEIRALLQRTSAPAPEAVAFQRTYAADEPCAGKTVADLVAAIGRAARTISTELQRDVHETVAADLAAGE
jgi:ABC-type uncharacterized transport system auxiliary subunit